MKPIRVLSPIKPGELCWVKVDGEWWLVRAEKWVPFGCSECCLDETLAGCPNLCGDGIYFSRVHPIPIAPDAPARDMKAGSIYVCNGVVYDGAKCDRIGPPEE